MSALKKLREAFRSRPRMSPEEYAQKLISKGLNPDGTPVLDPTPMAPPIGYKKHPSMVEIVRDMVRSENLARVARENGAETFEEAEDFDVGDEPELMRSPWENQFDPDLSEILQAGRAALAEKAKAPAVASPPRPSSEVPLGGAGGLPPAEGRVAAGPEGTQSKG